MQRSRATPRQTSVADRQPDSVQMDDQDFGIRANLHDLGQRGMPRTIQGPTALADEQSDRVKVQVTAYYRNSEDFRGAHICQAGEEGNAGVFIIVSVPVRMSNACWD